VVNTGVDEGSTGYAALQEGDGSGGEERHLTTVEPKNRGNTGKEGDAAK